MIDSKFVSVHWTQCAIKIRINQSQLNFEMFKLGRIFVIRDTRCAVQELLLDKLKIKICCTSLDDIERLDIEFTHLFHEPPLDPPSVDGVRRCWLEHILPSIDGRDGI
jgi:hypothetical protein